MRERLFMFYDEGTNQVGDAAHRPYTEQAVFWFLPLLLPGHSGDYFFGNFFKDVGLQFFRVLGWFT